MKNNSQMMVSRFYQQVAKVFLATSVVWTVVTVYKALEKDYSAEVEPEIIAPISPVIDEKVISKIRTREQMKELISTYVPSSPSPSPGKSGI